MCRFKFLLFYFCLIHSLFSTSYFISSSIGKDSNNGLFPNQGQDKNGPFASFSMFSQNSFFKPGDTIFIKSGDRWENLTDIRIRISGNSNNPVKITSYGGNGFPELNFSAKVAGFYIHDYSKTIQNIIIEKIYVRGNGEGWGFFITQDEKGGRTNNIILRNLKISNFKIGIHSQASSNLTIENSEIFSSGEMGILGGVNQSGLVIRNNQIYESGFQCPRPAKIYCHNIYLSYGEKVLIEKNTIYRGSNFGIILHGKLKDVEISENELFQNNNAIAVDPGYVDKPEGFINVKVSKNLVHEHKGSWLFSFQSIENLSFTENIIYNEENFNIVVRKKFLGDLDLKNAKFINNQIFTEVKKIFSLDDKTDESKILWKDNNLYEIK